MNPPPKKKRVRVFLIRVFYNQKKWVNPIYMGNSTCSLSHSIIIDLNPTELIVGLASDIHFAYAETVKMCNTTERCRER